MFSKSLFKQSCKANGVMWTIITVAVCFMLACVMIIAGNGNLGDAEAAIIDTIAQDEIKSATELRAINYYEIATDGLEYFNNEFINKYNSSLKPDEDKKFEAAYKSAFLKFQLGMMGYFKEKGIDPLSPEAQEMAGAVIYILNPPQELQDEMNELLQKEAEKQGVTIQPIDVAGFYSNLNDIAQAEYNAMVEAAEATEEGGSAELAPFEPISAPNYTEDVLKKLIAGQDVVVRDFVMKYSNIFLAGQMIKDENIDLILDELSAFNITPEKFATYGFDKYYSLKSIADVSLVNYRSTIAYLEQQNAGDVTEAVKEQTKLESTKSLLATLPEEVSNALMEIGSADLYGIMIGSVFFKMAGLLLPMIYMIMTANALIAGQVDSGSMAYVLSSSTKRKQVTFTQAVYMIGSLFAMFVCTTVTSMICFACVGGKVATGLTYGKLALINLGAFVVMFAMSGISFLASCWFNRSKHSTAVGGGLNMFFLVASMLGLFGSEVLPSLLRMDALNAFNYVSIISLFDVVDIINGGLNFIWEMAILLVIGIICYIVGSLKFEKKDLPL